jgi:RNA polymerase sigma-70 factor (ECF subfamily)
MRSELSSWPAAGWFAQVVDVRPHREGEKNGKSDYIKQMNQGLGTCQTKESSAGASQLSDRDLVTEVLCKDRKATAEFVTRYADHVYAYVRRRLIPRADLVDDLVQEVFLAAWENLEKFRGDASLRSWLLGIARHKVEDHYRKRLRETQFQDEEESMWDEPARLRDVEEALAKRQAGQRTQEILKTLPETYSLILLWRYWEKRSLRDIAVQIGKTEKAVERMLARARQQFKKRWYERRSSARG